MVNFKQMNQTLSSKPDRGVNAENCYNGGFERKAVKIERSAVFRSELCI